MLPPQFALSRRRCYHGFVLGTAGAAVHLALLLGCLALGLPGGAPILAIALFLVGTLALLAVLAARASRTQPRPALTVLERGAAAQPSQPATTAPIRATSTRLVL